MMKRILLFLLAVTVFTLAFTGCGGPAKPTLKVYNAGQYIDPEVIADFEGLFGVDVIYDEFDSNESMYVQVANDTYTYDVVVPSDYLIDRMIKEDRLLEINHANVPNISKISPEYLNPVYDEGNKYSVPYMVGTLGILYDSSVVPSEEVASWDVMWDEKYEGLIFMWDSMRDVIGMSLKSLGYSMNSEDDEELEEAKQKLIKQKPLLQAYVSDEMKDKMIGQQGVLGLMYSGDAMDAINANPTLAYAVPEEGSNKWVDSFVILKNSPNKDLAETFINYMCREDVAARNMEATGYTSPIKSAATEEMLANPTMFPSEELLDKCEAFTYSKTATEKYAELWTEIKAAK